MYKEDSKKKGESKSEEEKKETVLGLALDKFLSEVQEDPEEYNGTFGKTVVKPTFFAEGFYPDTPMARVVSSTLPPMFKAISIEHRILPQTMNLLK